MMNYPLRPRVSREDDSTIYPLNEDMRRFRVLLRTLDVLLKREWNRVDLYMVVEELVRWADVVTKEFVQLGALRDSQAVSDRVKTRKIVVKDGTAVNPVPERLAAAYVEWWTKGEPDGEWVKCFLNSKKDAATVADVMAQELKRRYGITQDQILILETSITARIEKHLSNLDRLRFPFIHFSREQMKETLLKIVRGETADLWMKELTYRPDGNFCRSPFVRVEDGGSEYYVPIIASFVPLKSFGQAWVYDITKGYKRSSTAGLMSKQWGSCLRSMSGTDFSSINPG